MKNAIQIKTNRATELRCKRIASFADKSNIHYNGAIKDTFLSKSVSTTPATSPKPTRARYKLFFSLVFPTIVQQIRKPKVLKSNFLRLL